MVLGFVWNILLSFGDDEFWVDGEDQPRSSAPALDAVNAWIKDGKLVDLTAPTFRRGAGAGMEARLYGGGFKHFDIDGFIRTVKQQDWKDRPSVQIFICGGESRPFRVFSLRARRKPVGAPSVKPRTARGTPLDRGEAAAGKLMPPKRRRKIKVGDRMILLVGSQRMPAEVVEDRGFIGKGGRQLLRIRRVDVSPELAQPYEVLAEELELAE